MPKLSRFALTTLLLAGLSAGFTTDAFAQYDTLRPIPEPQPLPISMTQPVAQSGTVIHGGTVYPAQSGYPNYGGIHYWDRSSARQVPPWNPRIYPVYRVPVQYLRYWPQRWYGDPRRGVSSSQPYAPMVYQPTDTTQLGYYYQHAPSWQRNPGMLPAGPHPRRYHQFDFSWRGAAADRYGYPHGSHGGAVIQSAPDSSMKNSTPSGPKQTVPPSPTDLNKSAGLPFGRN